MDRDVRTSIAVREAREFKKRLERDFLLSQVGMLIILSAMVYFGSELKWIVVVGLWTTAGTIGYLIKELAIRLDAGRSYVEIWSNDAEDALARIEDHMRSIVPPSAY
jgi:hypothetical protein